MNNINLRGSGSKSIFEGPQNFSKAESCAVARETTALESVLNDLLTLTQRLENIGNQARINADRIVGCTPQACGTDGQKAPSPDGVLSMIRLQLDFLFHKATVAEMEVERLNNI